MQKKLAAAAVAVMLIVGFWASAAHAYTIRSGAYSCGIRVKTFITSSHDHDHSITGGYRTFPYNDRYYVWVSNVYWTGAKTGNYSLATDYGSGSYSQSGSICAAS